MSSQLGPAHRSLFRELIRSSISRRKARSGTAATALFGNQSERLPEQDARDAANFLKAQRLHKTLLERYNPLHDLTPEERIKATARRVGLDMPIEVKDRNDN